MPYAANGTWIPWSSYLNVSNSTDPISGVIHSGTSAVPLLFPVFLGFLYVFLWVKFSNAPSRFKLVGITALVLVISVVMAAGGFTTDAVLNFIAFVVAYFLSMLFKG